MYKILFTCAIFLCLASCNNTKQVQNTGKTQTFGAKISDKNAMPVTALVAKLNDVSSLSDLTVVGEIESCCAKKGCWMKLKNGDAEPIRVTFKDYAFFVPLNSAGRTATIKGTAFVKEISVADLRHYAEDAGKSADEIAAITEAKKEITFEAEGVILK